MHYRRSLENHHDTRFQTKMGKIYTRDQTKMAQKPNHPFGGMYLYGLYNGVPPLHPIVCVLFTYLFCIFFSLLLFYLSTLCKKYHL